MDALDLLTLDCWREVLDRVKDPEDLKACSEACVIFEALLWNKKKLFLFDLILPEISEYLTDIRRLGGDDGVEQEIDDWIALFNCRLVCKDWCKSVDGFAETSFLFEDRYSFNSGEMTERFLKMFETHTGNPIIGRSVTIVHGSTLLMAQPQEDDQNENVPQAEIFYVTKIRELLNQFGNEIRTLELMQDNFGREERAIEPIEHDNGVGRLRRENLHHLALCKNLQTMIGHLPNLRYLQFRSDDRLDRLIYMGDNLEEMDQEGNINAELTTYLTANPLTPLPNLEVLEIDGLNLVMTRSILEKCSSQLTYLATTWDPRRFLEELPGFRCLNDLKLSVLDPSASLQCLRELHSPLESLSLTIRRNENQTTLWSIDEVFGNIQHLPIRELDIFNACNVFLGESAQISPERRVRHESITKIKIDCARGTVSLNFLASCPNLEEFYMFQRGRCAHQALPSGHPKGVAELFDVTALVKEDPYDLYQSNIWEGIPSLKTFTLGGFSQVGAGDYRRIDTPYNRKTYEEQNKGEGVDAGRP